MPQPSTTGMVIPQASPDSGVALKSINFNTSSIETMLERFFKFTKKDKEILEKKTAELIKHNKRIEGYTKPSPAEEKKKKGLSKYFDKWFVKKDFLKTLGGFFKKLIDRAGGWLKTLLEILLFFAIFDPGGSFLEGIFNLVVSLLEKAINFLIPKVPIVAKRMWKLFWDVVVPGFGKLGKSIGEALFGKDSAMSKVMGDFGELIPIIIAVAGAISYLVPIIEGIITLSSFLIANPIVAVIAGIVIAVVLIYLFRDQIAEFFEVTLPKWFKSLGGTMKAVVMFILIITAPLWGLIYGLAKLFQSFKKIGVKKTMQIIWDGMKEGIKKVGDWLAGIPGRVGDWLKEKMSSLSNLGSSIYQGAKDMIPPWIKDAVLKIKDYLMGVFDWLQAFRADPKSFLPFGGNTERAKAAEMAVKVKRSLETGEEGNIVTKAAGVSATARKGMSISELQELILANAELFAKQNKQSLAETMNQKIDYTFKVAKTFETF